MAAVTHMFPGAINNTFTLTCSPSRTRTDSVRTLESVHGLSGWWYRVATAEESGGVWLEKPTGRLGQLLPWCPEVLALLVARDLDGRSLTRYFTVRVQGQIATLAATHLEQGNGWAQFSAIDLWDCLSLRSVLAGIVQDQAQGLSRICFQEDVQ